MPDLKTVLTETLAKHRQSPEANGWISCACDGNFGRYTCVTWERHVADVLLGLSGVAVTQLPEPQSGRFVEIGRAPIRDARLSLIGDWHDQNEAGCCDDTGPFCQPSREWANGYLAAIVDAETAGVEFNPHTCNGHPTDRCDACREAKRLVQGGKW